MCERARWGIDHYAQRASETIHRQANGDACEMLVAAELTLAGVPALKVPDNWPGYDVVAQPKGGVEPLKVSVKSRTHKKGPAFVTFLESDPFDWLAMALLDCDAQKTRRTYLIPAEVAQREARRNRPGTKNARKRYWHINEIGNRFAKFENNFKLLRETEIPN